MNTGKRDRIRRQEQAGGKGTEATELLGVEGQEEPDRKESDDAEQETDQRQAQPNGEEFLDTSTSGSRCWCSTRTAVPRTRIPTASAAPGTAPRSGLPHSDPNDRAREMPGHTMPNRAAPARRARPAPPAPRKCMTQRAPTTAPSTPSGRSTKKIQRQSTLSVMSPPMVGPAVTPSDTISALSPSACPRCATGNAPTISARAGAKTMAAPSPGQPGRRSGGYQRRRESGQDRACGEKGDPRRPQIFSDALDQVGQPTHVRSVAAIATR